MLASGLVENLSITHLNLAHNKVGMQMAGSVHDACIYTAVSGTQGAKKLTFNFAAVVVVLPKPVHTPLMVKGQHTLYAYRVS